MRHNMLENQLNSLLATAELARVASRLKQLAMPSIRLRANRVSEAELPLGASKLGGLPDLSPGQEWPIWRGIPLAFIAQINLAEMHAFDVMKKLPSSRFLYFFYDAEHTPVGYDPAWRGGWRVLYEETASANLQRRPVPLALRNKQSMWLPEEQHYMACTLTFSVEMTLPPSDSLLLDALHLSRQEVSVYDKALMTIRTEDRQPIHRLLGYPDTLQGDMQVECQLVSSGLNLGDGKEYFSERARALRHGAEAWQLLLQLDTDPEPQMVWGIEGRSYYWIRRDALQERQFEDAWFVMQWT